MRLMSVRVNTASAQTMQLALDAERAKSKAAADAASSIADGNSHHQHQ